MFRFLFVFFREGTNQYEKAFGVDAKDLFQALYRFVEKKKKPHTLIYIPSPLLYLKPVCQPLCPSSLKKNTHTHAHTDSWDLLARPGCVMEGVGAEGKGGGRGCCHQGQRLVGSDVTRRICHCP